MENRKQTRKNKCLPALLLAVVLLAASFGNTFSVFATDDKCGENATWSYNGSTQELVISGTGEMNSYVHYYDQPWAYKEIKKVIIQDGITSIGMKCFGDLKYLESVEIPNSVLKILPFAFYDCENLMNISIPDSVTFMGQEAFLGTPIYADAENYDNGVLYYDNILLDSEEFRCNDNLLSYNVKEGTRVIASEAFVGFDAMIEITIPDSVVELGYNTFMNCTSLRNVKLSENLTDIKDSVFNGCTSLGTITIGDAVTDIGEKAFSECNSLTDIDLPESLRSVGTEAFRNTGISTFYLPKSIEWIGEGAFCNPYYSNICYSGSEADWNNIEFKDPSEAEKYTVTYNYMAPTEEDTTYTDSEEDNGNDVVESHTDTSTGLGSGPVAAIVISLGVVAVGGVVLVLLKKRKK